jgi:hypothetical protein
MGNLDADDHKMILLVSSPNSKRNILPHLTLFYTPYPSPIGTRSTLSNPRSISQG